MNQNLKLSVISPSYNQGKYIEDMLLSIKSQNYKNFEHIVMDACSTDETESIVRRYNFSKFISEKDKGPAAALNKGFKLATGDIFCWINTDDYFEKNIFETVINVFQKSNADLVFGNLTYVDANRKVLSKEKTTGYDFNSLIHKNPYNVRQPSTFFTRKIFEKVGGLNEDLKTIFDYEMFLRMLKITKPVYIDKNLAYYRDHIETITRLGMKKQSRELLKVIMNNGGKLTNYVTLRLIKRSIFG